MPLSYKGPIVSPYRTYRLWSDSLGEFFNFNMVLTSVPEMNKPNYDVTGLGVKSFFEYREKGAGCWSAWYKAKDWRPVKVSKTS